MVIIMETFDLSNSQKQILNSENVSKNSLKFKYSLPLNLEEYINEALDLLINNYLNLQITQEEDLFKQYIAPQIQGNYIFKDLSNNKKEDEVINEFLSQDFKEYLNVPLYKFLIIKTNNDIEIIGNIHSLLSDIGSITKLYDYLVDIINSLKSNKEYESDSNTFSYKKFIDSFNDYSLSKSYEEDVQFYVNQLNDISSYVDRLSLIKEFSFDKKVLKLNDKLISNIQKLLKEKGDISKLTFFTSILSIYLSRTNNSQGTIFKTYYYRDYENIVPVKIPFNKLENFNETLNNNQKIFEDSYSHANISFNDYSNLLNNQIDNSLLLYYSIREIPHNECVEFLSYGDNEDSALSITINNWDLEFQYNNSKFSDIEIEHLICNLESLLQNILEDTSKSLNDYDIISDEEKSLIEKYSKGKTVPFDHSKILTDYIAYYAQETPDNYAIEDKDSKITYKQFNEDISSLSYQLINNEGISKGDVVAIMLPRLYSFPLTFLSIMKAGATFVYIDPEYPLERINSFILNTTQADF